LSVDSFQLHDLLARLISAEVRFVAVGGLAVGAWGYVRATRDLDLVPDPAPENLERLATLLRDLDGRVEVAEGLLAADAISTFLKTGDRTLVVTSLGRVDVIQGNPQIPTFATLDAAATDVEIDGLSVRICSLEHLLEMKRASERPRDRDDVEALEGARRDEDSKN
jgi:predicted nucleotidyltransferase